MRLENFYSLCPGNVKENQNLKKYKNKLYDLLFRYIDLPRILLVFLCTLTSDTRKS